MKDIMIYKDLIGSVHYSTEDEVFYGRIEGINDSVSFEGNSVNDVLIAIIRNIEIVIEVFFI